MGYEIGIMIANPVKEGESMNVAVEEKLSEVEAVGHEEYEDADFEEVMRLSSRLIEQHREAYTALANA